MAWDSELPTIVRNMVNDLSDTPTYSDDRLATSVLIAAMQVQQEAAFPTAYAVSVENQTMTPDCTVGDNRSESFINLVCLKSAYTLVSNEIKLQNSQGIRIREGTSEIDLKRDSGGMKLLLQTYEAGYKDALYLYRMGQSEVGHAIVGPHRLQGECRHGLGYYAQDDLYASGWNR